jgi:hypothetical protein
MFHIMLTALFVIAFYATAGGMLLYIAFVLLLDWNYQANVLPSLIEEDNEDIRLYQRNPRR